MEEIIKDFGQWKVPTKWEDVTLQQISELERLYSNDEKKIDIRDVIAILARKTVDEVNALPSEFLEIILSKMEFLETRYEDQEPSNKVVLDGETYLVHTERTLKTGEAIAAQMAISADKYDYPTLLAIICRKDDEVFDSHYENEVLPLRIEMWKKVPALKVMPLIAFFLKLWMLRQSPSVLSSQCEEELSQLANVIETSYKDGGISKRSMKSAKKQLDQLRKSINGTT